LFHSIPLSFANRPAYKNFALFHLLIALPIKILHHPLPGNQTETSVRFGCAYLKGSSPTLSAWLDPASSTRTNFLSFCVPNRVSTFAPGLQTRPHVSQSHALPNSYATIPTRPGLFPTFKAAFLHDFQSSQWNPTFPLLRACTLLQTAHKLLGERLNESLIYIVYKPGCNNTYGIKLLKLTRKSEFRWTRIPDPSKVA
jgi:hypothetical protein